MTNDLNDHNDHKCCNCPYSPHDQTTSWPFHYFIFYKGSKTFSTMQIFIEEIANLPFKFSVTQGCMYLLHRVLRAVAKLWKNAIRESRFLWMLFVNRVFYECYSWIAFSMNAIRESRFLWMLFASHVFYGSVRNSGDSLMTVVFMSSAKGVAICDGVLSSSSTCL